MSDKHFHGSLFFICMVLSPLHCLSISVFFSASFAVPLSWQLAIQLNVLLMTACISSYQPSCYHSVAHRPKRGLLWCYHQLQSEPSNHQHIKAAERASLANQRAHRMGPSEWYVPLSACWRWASDKPSGLREGEDFCFCNTSTLKGWLIATNGL